MCLGRLHPQSPIVSKGEVAPVASASNLDAEFLIAWTVHSAGMQMMGLGHVSIHELSTTSQSQWCEALP